MNEDYLWNKMGNDPDIEKLENALQAFRYKKTAPPVLPAKVLPFREEKPRKFFQFGFAFAACSVFCVILLGVWLQVSNNEIEVVNDLAETNPPQTKVEFRDEPLIKKADDSTVEKIGISKQSVKRKVVKIHKSVSRQNKTTVQNTKVKKPILKLTEEEKYAYDRLMLALSITSSKLKLVKDKVEGIENQNAVLENER